MNWWALVRAILAILCPTLFGYAMANQGNFSAATAAGGNVTPEHYGLWVYAPALASAAAGVGGFWDIFTGIFKKNDGGTVAAALVQIITAISAGGSGVVGKLFGDKEFADAFTLIIKKIFENMQLSGAEQKLLDANRLADLAQRVK